MRPVPPSRQQAATPPESTTNPATLALHGQLIDPATSTRSDADPLAHLEPPPLSTPSRHGAVPLAPRRGAGSAGDDDLGDLFTDGPEDAAGPSLLDPERQPPGDPLTLLQQPSGFDRPAAFGLPMAPPAPPPGNGEQPPRLDRNLPAPEARAPIIPEDWDPGLGIAARSPLPLPRQPIPAPNAARVLPLPPQRQADPVAPAGDLQSLFAADAPNGPAGPADDSVDQALALLRCREAARGGAGPAETPVRADPHREDAAPALSASDGLETLWQALGIDPSRMPEADRQRLLAEIGRTIREIADGLIQILAARQHLKSEFRVDQTVLRPTENNLFKFTRNAGELLSLAMSNRNRVFLPMDQAAHEALDDIKAHELATLAAVQMSIRAVVDRFQPDKLARQAAQQPRGRFDWLKLRSAKARWWDFFQNMYANLAADADEASNRIFTAEFGRAYRERVEKRPNR